MMTLSKARASKFYYLVLAVVLLSCALTLVSISGAKASNGGYSVYNDPKYKRCVQKYVPKTRTKMAASIVANACRATLSVDKVARKRGRCILRLRNIYKANNDRAAIMIRNSSRCRKD